MNESRKPMPIDDLIRETFSADIPPEVAAGMRGQFQAFRRQHVKPASTFPFSFINFLLTHRIAAGVAATFCFMALVGMFFTRQSANQFQPLPSSYIAVADKPPMAESSFRCEADFYGSEASTEWKGGFL